MKITPNAPTAGSAILTILLVLLVAVGLVGISVLLTSSQNRMAARQREVMGSAAAADGGIEYAFAVWKNLSQRTGRAPTNSELSADQRIVNLMAADNSTHSPALELAATGNTLAAFSIATTDPWGLPYVGPGYAIALMDYPGWTGISSFYKATVTATGPRTLAGAQNVSATVSRYFSRTTVPLFQAAIFYMGDLEIHPGAEMTIKGLVHTNADLYASGYAKLKFLDNVSYGGSFYERAPTIGDWTGGSGTGGDPTVTPYWSDDLQTGASTTRAQQLHGPLDRIEPFGAPAQTLFDTDDTNHNNDGYREWVEPPVAGTGINADVPEIAEQRLYNKASLRIEIDSSKPVSNPTRIKVTDNSGSNLGTANTNLVKAAIDSGTTIYDWREGGGLGGQSSGSVRVTSVDMKVLNTALTALGSNFDGVLYVNDVANKPAPSPSPAPRPPRNAIRLKNGAFLARDLTVASENPVYIQGDYNTGGVDGSGNHNPNLVPSNDNGGNTDGSENPFAPGYVKKSAAVIADAVTILSNNWNDSNSADTIGSRIATPTTVNTAIMAGDVPTNYQGNGAASGGAHNLPRFLEAWYNSSTSQSVDFTYYGSMVQAFNSKNFTGAWTTGNVYFWPNRKWNFDSLFNSNPPPGTVSGTKFSRGRWERL